MTCIAPFEDTLKKIGFKSISPVRSPQWTKEANNFYADWMENCSDKEFERAYPPPKIAKFESVVRVPDYEVSEYVELIGE